MIKYKYTIEDTTIETLDINLIPEGLEFETVEFEQIFEEQDYGIEIKKHQYQQLLETDWYVTRFVETGKPIPSDILELRNQIRNAAD